MRWREALHRKKTALNGTRWTRKERYQTRAFVCHGPVSPKQEPWARAPDVDNGTMLNVLSICIGASLGALARWRLGVWLSGPGALLPWAPLVGGQVRAVVASGTSVAFGGTFRVVGGIAKRNLVALDVRTGRPGVVTPDLPFKVATLLQLGGVFVAGGERPYGLSLIHISEPTRPY